MIRVVWFIACMGKWRNIIRQELSCLQESGLFEVTDEILVCQAGEGDLNLPDKCQVVEISGLDSFEFPALRIVRNTAQEGDKILYLHTKGVSRKGDAFIAGNHWREYLLWGCVERWREHIQVLDSCDVSGVQLTHLDKTFGDRCGNHRVFAGNFWWAKGEWVKQLPAPLITKNPSLRWMAEGWIFSAGFPRVMDLHNLTQGGMMTDKIPFGPGFTRTLYDSNAKVLGIPPRMIEYRWQIINSLISHFGYEKYLEIGLFRGRNFKHILCSHKESVDPSPIAKADHIMTSDEFFEKVRKGDKWDLIFVDGLHTKEQVLRDIDNALDHLSKNGTVVVHDCNPETEWEQRDLSAYDGVGVWLGTVWKGFAKLRMTRPDLYMAVIDADFGCGIIRSGRQRCFPEFEGELSFPFFTQNRKELMNVIEPEDFWLWLQGMSK